jgi:hypothetical protein
MSRRSPAHDVALMFEAAGSSAFGGSDPWSINVGGLPERPDDVAAIIDDGGPGALLYGQEINRPQIQILLRARDYNLGWNNINDGVNYLLKLHRREFGAYFYWGFDQTGDIMSLGPDDRGLFMFSANLYLHRQPINT